MGSASLRCLRCLSLKPAFSLGAISFTSSFFSSSRSMKGMVGSGSWSELSPIEGEPDESPTEGDEAEINPRPSWQAEEQTSSWNKDGQ